ncbi:hypothetical protein ABT336_02295 [Micromonospora sp. NPDC000207]|uniref:hypothetical protein n=1 Tax=Micromonospora sp. NPDC000207 TaxID=3154246 RepID=UPI00331C627E
MSSRGAGWTGNAAPPPPSPTNPEGVRIAYSSSAEFARADADQATCKRGAFSETIATYGTG